MNKPVSPAEASAGHNKPAILTPDMMARDFAYIDEPIAELRKLFADSPAVTEDEEDLEIARSIVKRCTGVYKRLETLRVDAKDPYLAAERIVDGHFNPLKTLVDGWKSVTEARAHRFLKKKEAEELAIREEEARRSAEAARVAAEAVRQAEQDRIAAEQAQLAEAFANSAPPTEEHQQRASAARVEETVLRTVALQKSADAMRAQEATKAKPADLARTRTGTGLSTLAEIWLHSVDDFSAVDLNDPVLRSFISDKVIDTAIAAYVRTHKDTRPLKGVSICRDTKPMMT